MHCIKNRALWYTLTSMTSSITSTSSVQAVGIDCLPQEMLCHILERVEPGSVGVLRGVKRSWRDAFDACGDAGYREELRAPERLKRVWLPYRQRTEGIVSRLPSRREADLDPKSPLFFARRFTEIRQLFEWDITCIFWKGLVEKLPGAETMESVRSRLGRAASDLDLLSYFSETWIPAHRTQLHMIDHLALARIPPYIDLPAGIKELTRLAWLDLSCSQLTHVPDRLWQLTHLKAIALFGNQLKSLPPEIGKMACLERLFLENNLLETVPPEIGNLPKLRVLSIQDNPIRSLPRTLSPSQHRRNPLDRLNIL